VRKIHTGFAGPATGVQHELLVHEFELQIEELLQEGTTAAATNAPTRELPTATPAGSP